MIAGHAFSNTTCSCPPFECICTPVHTASTLGYHHHHQHHQSHHQHHQTHVSGDFWSAEQPSHQATAPGEGGFYPGTAGGDYPCAYDGNSNVLQQHSAYDYTPAPPVVENDAFGQIFQTETPIVRPPDGACLLPPPDMGYAAPANTPPTFTELGEMKSEFQHHPHPHQQQCWSNAYERHVVFGRYYEQQRPDEPMMMSEEDDSLATVPCEEARMMPQHYAQHLAAPPVVEAALHHGAPYETLMPDHFSFHESINRHLHH